MVIINAEAIYLGLTLVSAGVFILAFIKSLKINHREIRKRQQSKLTNKEYAKLEHRFNNSMVVAIIALLGMFGFGHCFNVSINPSNQSTFEQMR